MGGRLRLDGELSVGIRCTNSIAFDQCNWSGRKMYSYCDAAVGFGGARVIAGPAFRVRGRSQSRRPASEDFPYLRQYGPRLDVFGTSDACDTED